MGDKPGEFGCTNLSLTTYNWSDDRLISNWLCGERDDRNLCLIQTHVHAGGLALWRFIMTELLSPRRFRGNVPAPSSKLFCRW